MSDEWLGHLQFWVVLAQIRPSSQMWKLKFGSHQDIQLITKVDTLSSVLKDPQIPVVYRRLPPSMPEKLPIVYRWPILLGPVKPGLYKLSSLLLPSFSLVLPHPSQNFILNISKVHTALPLVLMSHFFRKTIPEARTQRCGPTLLQTQLL